MSRGRYPKKAISEAEAIANRRGEVRLVPGRRSDSFDLIIFEGLRTVFVKVKRSLTTFTWPLEILHQYQRDIAHVHRIPLTAVTAREIWIRHPNRKWQFFLVRHDSVVQIGAGGFYTPPAEIPAAVREPAGECNSSDDDNEFTS